MPRSESSTVYVVWQLHAPPRAQAALLHQQAALPHAQAAAASYKAAMAFILFTDSMPMPHPQAAWLLFIFAGYFVARAGCYVGLPVDGVTNADAYDTFDDISKMLQFGVVLAVFLHVMELDRFRYIFIK